MHETTAEFVVVGDVQGTQFLPDEYRTVIGRCGDAPIRVGDCIDAVVRLDEPRTVDDYERDPVEISREKVSLVVRRIRAYDRDREVLDRGMAGSLVVTGEGLDKLGGTCTLLVQSPVGSGNGARPQRVSAERSERTSET